MCVGAHRNQCFRFMYECNAFFCTPINSLQVFDQLGNILANHILPSAPSVPSLVSGKRFYFQEDKALMNP